MAAYVIADVLVTDPVAMADYLKGTPATIAAYGGTYLARGGAIEVVEGDWPTKRLTVIRFETFAKAKAWFDSPEYAPLKALRKKAATSKFAIVEGV